MPTYEYRCEECEYRFETWQKITDTPFKICPKCGGKLTKIIFPAGIIFKGDGFYITEQRKERKIKEKTEYKDIGDKKKQDVKENRKENKNPSQE